MSRPSAVLGPHLDAADGQQPVDLLLRKAVHRLVGRQAVFVQAAELGLVVEQGHRMAQHRQPVSAGQPGRPGADHRHALAAGRRAREQRRTGLGEVGVGGMALQQADLDRLVFLRAAHAGLLAQHLGRADAGAHAAEHVLFQDGARCTTQVALGDAGDEGRDVDAGRAGRGAGRVVAVVAALGFQQRLHGVERRVRVGEVARVLGLRQPAGSQRRRDVGCAHGAGSSAVGARCRCIEAMFYHLVNSGQSS
jgi:hypothetical protein